MTVWHGLAIGATACGLALGGLLFAIYLEQARIDRDRARWAT